ncbi:MAG: low molecular weight phosphotyrosine protein phosphatase [Lewinellaceae bacterium]|nr:low molecular weight phosphotyrosine protein phosphatase [Lewinellaceae bacterium]
MKILMVCLGNICRSPLAEGILKHKAQQHNLSWVVDSAGTGHWHIGQLPDARSIAVAQRHGIDITDQRARQFHPDDFDRFDRIFVMDTQNHRDVLQLAQTETHRAKVHLMLNLTYPGQNRNVPDPYHDDNGFEEVFQMLDKACEKMVSVGRLEG